MKRKTRRICIILVVAILPLCLIFAGLAYWLCGADFTDGEDTYIYIRSGEKFEDVCRSLEEAAPDGRMGAFKLADRLLGYHKNVRPGRYRVSGISSLQLIRNLRNGQQEPLMLTVPIAWTPPQLAGKLATRLEADSASFAKVFSDSLLLKEIGVPQMGLFALIVPDTYEIYWTIKPEDFLRRMKREYDRFWTSERDEKAASQGLSRDETYVLASIVERETANEAEKPVIAGLYLNRLRKGMKLQADPTVKFAVGDFALRRILLRHLRTPSPYNTYLHEGLPPAPISLPSRSSIEAVLKAGNHDYLYMCAKEDFSGAHNFASTFSEHQQNARRYVEALNARGIK